jgi:hypothetical protein
MRPTRSRLVGFADARRPLRDRPASHSAPEVLADLLTTRHTPFRDPALDRDHPKAFDLAQDRIR